MVALKYLFLQALKYAAFALGVGELLFGGDMLLGVILFGLGVLLGLKTSRGFTPLHVKPFWLDVSLSSMGAVGYMLMVLSLIRPWLRDEQMHLYPLILGVGLLAVSGIIYGIKYYKKGH